MDTNKDCFSCGTSSTILDGKTWVCAEHIRVCQCKRNHAKAIDYDFNQNRPYADGYLMESMVKQLAIEEDD